ncbi:hypothetical protein GGQ74_002942 [Desulfobaculum xiamenense]|uniref:Uncharacterized protein n=1 Tax=Desulfobaculum xiamenense TaxID=995050 RepID=A0A846QUN8_9BACT|nr:hypothetical protein [Desulfobaculum xiamenense]NJB69245.1 hypothetical protein [Desulfobaculum xiamenense]
MGPVLRNWMRHFLWSLCAVCYVGSMPVIVYQLLGQGRSWPGLFVRTAVLPGGEWRAHVVWDSPGLVAVACAALVAAGIYATWRRHDFLSYRESRFRSAGGF